MLAQSPLKTTAAVRVAACCDCGSTARNQTRYAANWLQGFGATEPGRPPLPFKAVARILALPAVPTAEVYRADGERDDVRDADGDASSPHPLAPLTAQISAVTTAPFAELILDGVRQGVLPTPRNARGEIVETQWTVSNRGLARDVAARVARGAVTAGPHDDGVGGNTKCTGTGSFPVNASGVQCHGLQRAAHGDASAEMCAKLCCADGGCDTWQLVGDAMAPIASADFWCSRWNPRQSVARQPPLKRVGRVAWRGVAWRGVAWPSEQ
jgi:hypothetical protein